MRTTTSGVFVASLASALSLAALASAGDKKMEPKGDKMMEMPAVVHCYGINKCKGVGACGGEGHSCKGQNACKGTGFLDLDKETCLKINGGRLTMKEEMAMPETKK